LPVFELLFLAVLLLVFISPSAAVGLMAYVDAAVGKDTGDCSDPTAPCLTINYAIGQTGDGSYIAVAGGEYVENVKLTDGLTRTIRGGHTNNAGDWTTGVFDPWVNPTVINGNNVDSTIEIRNHTDTIIVGVTIKGGKGLNDPTFGNGCGGLKIQSSDVDIVQSAISGNDGGTGEGGALCAAGDDGKMSLLIESTIVEGNRANVAGAFSLFNTTTIIANSLIMDNKSNSNYANVMTLLQDDDVWVVNSTIAYNNPTVDQAVDITSGKLAVQNSIMWHNSLNLQATPPCPTCFDVSYSNIEQTIPGTGNINKDPMFRDPAIFDLQLKPNSPCIDAGTAIDAPPKDIDGTPRVAKPDMGAYEYVAPIVYLPIVIGK
jgi:hypothetical protein